MVSIVGDKHRSLYMQISNNRDAMMLRVRLVT
jgi:hypothetical protein